MMAMASAAPGALCAARRPSHGSGVAALNQQLRISEEMSGEELVLHGQGRPQVRITIGSRVNEVDDEHRCGCWE